MKIKNLDEKELGYMFGLFEGDGYKYHDKKCRRYQVEFYLNSIKDKGIVNYLINLLEKIELNPNKYLDKRYNCIRVRVYSKELFEILKKNVALENRNKKFKLGFISGMIDSEGHVNKEKLYIMIVSTDKKTLEKCSEILSNMGLSSNVSKRTLSKKDKKFSYRIYVPVSFKNKAHLSIKTKRLQS